MSEPIHISERDAAEFADDPLRLAGRVYGSRLLLGTSRYPNPQTMIESLEAGGARIVTVSIRRLNIADRGAGSVLDYIDRSRYELLPNTAGCFTAKEAVLTAQLAREALGTDLVKVEVIGDEDTLLPDVEQLLKACNELVRMGFAVLPYCNDDLITCLKLQDMGCAAVMPLASPIGSGMGIRNPYNLEIVRERITIPMIIDAGIGTASDAARAMELGADGVLLNTAVAGAHHPVEMARAMRLAIEGGRLAYRAGRIPTRLYATASSPTEGMIGTAGA
ncbi:MAG TPA: thiazole synthase [Candidatus Kapabacteria bacterium]|nr:thiazole synthase [Candidatus Kapabacteria bacterium]